MPTYDSEITSNVKQLSDGNPNGTVLGQSTADKIALYGKAPIAQPASLYQGSINNLSGGAPSATIPLIGGTYSQADIANALTALYVSVTAIRQALVDIGAMKGSA